MTFGPVVILTTNLARGGAEAQVALLATELYGRGWPVQVISLLEPTAHAQELEAAGIAVHSLGMRARHADPRALPCLLSILRRVRPAILHSHMFHANVMARLARLVLPLPRVISTLHSVAESRRDSTEVVHRDRVYRWTDPLVDVTVAVSRAVGQRHVQARAVPSRKLVVIPNGIDTHRFRPDSNQRARLRAELGLENQFLWLAAGRLIWKKDYPTLLGAMALLPDVRLMIAGEGPLEAELKANATEHVQFLGARNDIPALMNAADGFVLSSSVEGLPMVLLEAAASGLPCVATAAGGVDEVIADGETGWVVPCRDPSALAAGMTRLMDLDGSSRAAMGRAARERAVTNFDIRRVVDRWEALYREA